MMKDLNDYVKDLAIEFMVGGDRFDQNDFAYAVSTVLKEDGVEAFREKVREEVTRTCGDRQEEICSKDFVEKQLEYWVPDEIVEQGKLLQMLEEKGKDYSAVHPLGFGVFTAYDADIDGGYECLMDKDGKVLYHGAFECVREDNKIKAGYSFDKVGGQIVGIGFREIEDSYEFVSLDMKTKECKVWGLSPEVANACSKAYVKGGCKGDVLFMTKALLVENSGLDGDHAMIEACRMNKLEPELSRGKRI